MHETDPRASAITGATQAKKQSMYFPNVLFLAVNQPTADGCKPRNG